MDHPSDSLTPTPLEYTKDHIDWLAAQTEKCYQFHLECANKIEDATDKLTRLLLTVSGVAIGWGIKNGGTPAGDAILTGGGIVGFSLVYLVLKGRRLKDFPGLYFVPSQILETYDRVYPLPALQQTALATQESVIRSLKARNESAGAGYNRAIYWALLAPFVAMIVWLSRSS